MVTLADTFAYLAAALVAVWGVMHAIPTVAVVNGFGDISRDSRRVITQEWLAEGFTMWFVAGLVIVVTAMGGSRALVDWVYRATAVMLLALGLLTALTGARTAVVWFKVCVVLLATTAALLLAASWV